MDGWFNRLLGKISSWFFNFRFQIDGTELTLNLHMSPKLIRKVFQLESTLMLQYVIVKYSVTFILANSWNYQNYKKLLLMFNNGAKNHASQRMELHFWFDKNVFKGSEALFTPEPLPKQQSICVMLHNEGHWFINASFQLIILICERYLQQVLHFTGQSWIISPKVVMSICSVSIRSSSVNSIV